MVMSSFTKRIVLWFIGIVFFVAGFDLVDWLVNQDKYEFTFKDSILVPLIACFICSALTFVFKKIGGKINKKETKEK